MQPRAIETRYKGYRFRSRLEARWAVFFDALGIKWEYEPEGFELGGGVRYLPDFRITVCGGIHCYVEIKPPGEIQKAEVNKLYLFSNILSDSGKDSGLIVVRGDPLSANAFMRGTFGGQDRIGELSFEDYVKVWSVFSRRCPVDVRDAAAAARGARFEHGEIGARA